MPHGEPPTTGSEAAADTSSLEQFADGRTSGTAQDGADAIATRLLDAAPDAIVVVDGGGRIRFANLRAESLFGYSRSELLGHGLDRLIPERFRPGHDGHVASFFGRPGVRPMGSGLELFGLRRDGTELPIEVSLSPLVTEQGTVVSAAIRDISVRKATEASAKLAAERLASAVDSMQDAFALFDSDDRLVLCNSVYRRLARGWLRGPVVGTPYEALLDAWLDDIAFSDEADRARFRAERLESRRRVQKQAPFELQLLDGRSLRITCRSTPEGGIVEVIADVTDDVQQAEALRGAREAADAANGAKSEFLSSMSHELRTPLNSILGFGQLLDQDRKDPVSPRHRQWVAQILKGGEHLLRLIDDILDLSRIEAGRDSMSTEPVSVLEVLDEIRTTLAPLAAPHAIAIDIERLGEGPDVVKVDRTRFSQILMNFGSNAIKYNREGGKVTFALSFPKEGYLRVSVRDTGFGIPLDKQHTLFRPFQRAGQEMGPIEGTGIGLVITKRLAELMHGGVGFHSVPNEGSEFWVEVPLDAPGSQSNRPPAAREDTTRLDRTGPASVLYVEDNPANVKFMEAMMDGLESIELIVARTAEAGLEVARARRPSVIIVDINLPGMSGLDALDALRAWPETREIPVIALTASASERDRRRGEKAGFHRYLTKPVKVEELKAALEVLLEPAANEP